MTQVRLFNSVAGYRVPRSRMTKLAEIILRSQKESRTVNLVLVEDTTMRQLNHKFRRKDRTTDVLSFAMEEDADPLLGEIYISVNEAARNATRFGRTVNQEILQLVSHGLLHLCGIHHANARARSYMNRLEDQYLSKLEKSRKR